MAVSFDHHQYTRIKVLCIWTVVLVMCLQIHSTDGRKHRHPPVVAFFQGHCTNNFCDQRCRDVDNGGYVCECYEGHKLNHDGITCSKIVKGKVKQVKETGIQRPDVVKIVSLDNVTEEIHLILEDNSTMSEDITIGSSVIKEGYKNTLQSAQTSNSNKDTQGNLDHTLTKTNDVTLNKAQDVHTDISLKHKNNDLTDIDKETFEENIVLGKDHEHLDDIKIKTFDHKSEAPDLESESLIMGESSEGTNLQNLVPNHIPKYSSKVKLVKPDNFVSQVSGGVRGERCDEFSCLNSGKCVDDGTVYRNKVRCDCVLGYLGEKCEKVVDVRYPRFYGNSYLALPVLKNGYKELDILLEFKPTARYGLVFFSSEFEDARSDFFSIALMDGYVEFRYDCGTGMGVLQSSNTVIMDQWNTLRVYREDNMATIWLNQDQPVHGASKGSFSRLTLRLNMYIGGYDNMGLLGNKIGTMKGFVGCVEQVVVNGYKYDLRKAELVGNSQFGANIGECSDGVCDNVVCQNGGLCQVTSADSHVCLCPLTTGGENCQHVTEVHIPEFQGHSYLEYVGLGRTALLFMEIEIVLKPTKADGVILYNGYTLERGGDFISLAMDNGHLEFRFDLGTGPAVIRSPEPIKLNKWHRVKISRTGMEGFLEVDGSIIAIGQSLGAFTQLTVTQNLFIGGHRNFDETSKLANVTTSFDGCIQKIIINNRPLDLIEDAIFGVNVANCEHPCVGEPCMNGGQCTPRKDIYTCYCPLGFTNNNCQTEINKDVTTPRFTSDSFLMYKQKRVSKSIGGDKVDIRFAIKPETPDGLLFWSGPDVMLSTSDYIALGFIDGALQFRYNLGSGEAVISYNNSRLFDGMWHYVHAQRDKQDGYLSVDGREIVEGSSKGSYTMLNTNKILYIGGMPDESQSTLKRFKSGYSGCIQDMVLGEDYNLQLLQVADSGRNIVPCS